MTTGAPPVGRDWLPTPSMTAPVLVLPSPRQPLDPPVVVTGRHARPEAVPDRRTGRASRRLLGALLNVAALLGLTMTTVTVYAATHGLHPLVVRSGSMEPTIHTGAMVLVQQVPAAAIGVGDVVAVKRPDGVTVTHRVVSLSRSGDLAQLVLKGDANQADDPDPVTVASGGRVVWTAPVLGRVAAWSASARGGFLLGCVFTAVLLSLRRRAP